MKYKLNGKVFTLLGVIFILYVGLMSIKGIVYDRISNKYRAISSIEKTNAGPQSVLGPVILINYSYQVDALDSVLEKGKYIRKIQNHAKRQIVLPIKLNFDVDLAVSERSLGIFSTKIYDSNFIFKGIFPEFKLDLPEAYIEGSLKIKMQVFVQVSDPRGIRQYSSLMLNNKSLEFDTAEHLNGIGIAALLDNKEQITESIAEQNFEFKMTLAGARKLSVIPVAKNTEMVVHGNWKDPNFIGSLPPTLRKITQNSFDATWNSNWIANNVKTNIEKEIFSDLDSFDMSFIDTLDHYQLTERSIKYGLLFIVLTFLAFYLFEFIKKIRIHPIQYALVGLAVVVFYILVLALSEYLSFGLSYLFGVIACISLISCYCYSIFHDRKLVLIFASVLASIYGVWYFILNAEQIALLAGAIFIFMILAISMFMTRKFDWYQASNPVHSDKDVLDSLKASKASKESKESKALDFISKD